MQKFIDKFEALQKEFHETAIEKGFWDNPCEDGTLIALSASELSEALEALRHGNPPSPKTSQYSCLEEELADTMIRIMDFAEYHGLDLMGAMLAKAQYNQDREHMNGGKRF